MLYLKQKETKGSSKADPLADLDISGMSVEEIADEIGKTVRGVKTMLTRRGYNVQTIMAQQEKK